MSPASNERMFCVSFYEGDIGWLPDVSEGNYRVYAKADLNEPSIDIARVTRVPNVGYNVYSYLRFIVDHYSALPATVVFCKNNVFPRHVSREAFIRLAARDVFTSIEEPHRWTLEFPVAMTACDQGYLELNNSWYARHHPTKYFATFNAMYQYIFADVSVPRYVRFAPGANYVVPRANILLRSRTFYGNLLTFCGHDQLAGESHIIERALVSIWTSPASESPVMTFPLSEKELARLSKARDEGVRRYSLMGRVAERMSISVVSAFGQRLGKRD